MGSTRSPSPAPPALPKYTNGTVRTYEVTPEEFGMKRGSLEDIAGGDAAANAAIIREILSGEESPRRDVVLLNAAAALVVAGKAEHLAQALPLAAESIDSGAAASKLAESGAVHAAHSGRRKTRVE